MFCNPKILHKTFNVEQINDKIRYYQINLDGEIYKFPSVTTILSHIKDSQKLEDLKQSLDEGVWDYLCDRGASRGTVMHKYLENFLLKYYTSKDLNESLIFTQKNTPIDLETHGIYTDKNKFYTLGRDLFYNFWYSEWFKEIKDIVFLESPLFSLKYKYAGLSDYAYINQTDQLIIGDYKSSTSKKTDEDIIKYKIQISAYMQAFFEMYGIRPDFGEIQISYLNNVDRFIVPFEDVPKYIDETFIQKTNYLHLKFQEIINN